MSRRTGGLLPTPTALRGSSSFSVSEWVLRDELRGDQGCLAEMLRILACLDLSNDLDDEQRRPEKVSRKVAINSKFGSLPATESINVRTDVAGSDARQPLGNQLH